MGDGFTIDATPKYTREADPPGGTRKCSWCLAFEDRGPLGYGSAPLTPHRIPACRAHWLERDALNRDAQALVRETRRRRKAWAKALRVVRALARIPLMPEPARTRARFRAAWEASLRALDGAREAERIARAAFTRARRA